MLLVHLSCLTAMYFKPNASFYPMLTSESKGRVKERKSLYSLNKNFQDKESWQLVVYLDMTSLETATDRQTRKEGWTLTVISCGTLHLFFPCSVNSKSIKSIKEGYVNISGRFPKWYTNIITQWNLSEVNYLNLLKNSQMQGGSSHIHLRG